MSSLHYNVGFIDRIIKIQIHVITKSTFKIPGAEGMVLENIESHYYITEFALLE